MVHKFSYENYLLELHKRISLFHILQVPHIKGFPRITDSDAVLAHVSIRLVSSLCEEEFVKILSQSRRLIPFCTKNSLEMVCRKAQHPMSCLSVEIYKIWSFIILSYNHKECVWRMWIFTVLNSSRHSVVKHRSFTLSLLINQHVRNLLRMLSQSKCVLFYSLRLYTNFNSTP